MPYRLLVLVFLLGIALGRLLWPHLALPFSNPLEAVGPLTLAEFNPATNHLRYAVFVSLPAALLWLLYGFHAPLRAALTQRLDERAAPRDTPLASHALLRASLAGATVALLVVYAWWGALGALDKPWGAHPLDFFHHGESLTPAFNHLRGAGVWTGSHFAHGAYFDVFSVYWAWQLLGVESIGAWGVSRSLDRALLAVALAGLVWAIAKTATEDRRWLARSLLIHLLLLVSIFGLGHRLFVLSERDLLVLVGVSALLLAFRWRSPALAFIAAAGSAGSYFVGIDRGAYFTATLIAVSLFFLAFSAPPRGAKWRLAAALVGGLAAGWGAFRLLVGAAELDAFFADTLRWYQVKDLIDSYVYPPPSWRPIRLHSRALWLNAFQLFVFVAFFLGSYAKGRSMDQGVAHFALLCLAVFYYRSGVGRSDQGHILYASTFAYLGAAFAVFLIVQRMRPGTSVAASLLGALVVANGIGVWLHRPSIGLSDLAGKRDAIGAYARLPDEAFLTSAERAGLRRLREIFAADACLYSLTSEAAMPYLLRKPSCGKNYIAWFASPRQRREELERDLERYRPRHILYHSTHHTARLDRIGNEQRFPDVLRFVLQRYRPYEIVAERWHVYRRMGAETATGAQALQ